MSTAGREFVQRSTEACRSPVSILPAICLEPLRARDSEDVSLDDPIDDFRGEPGEDDDERDDPERMVRCATCEHPVAKRDDRFAMNDRLDHVFTNPNGNTFHIGCWRAAAGCVGFGPESDEWAWFEGFSWQVAVCRGCAAHLGWFFRRDESSFAGLILPRLLL